MEKLIFTSKEEFKKGKGKFGPWTMWKISDNKGRRGITFNDLPLDTEVEVEIKEEQVEKDGKTFNNITFSLPKTKPVSWVEFNKLADRVGELERKVKLLEGKNNDDDEDYTLPKPEEESELPF